MSLSVPLFRELFKLRKDNKIPWLAFPCHPLMPQATGVVLLMLMNTCGPVDCFKTHFRYLDRLTVIRYGRTSILTFGSQTWKELCTLENISSLYIQCTLTMQSSFGRDYSNTLKCSILFLKLHNYQ